MKRLNYLIKKYHSKGGRNIIVNVPHEVVDIAGNGVIVACSSDHIRSVRNSVDDYIMLVPVGMSARSEMSTHKTSTY
jgi:hypothetical protein